MKIAVCDDNGSDLEAMLNNLQLYGKRNYYDMTIDVFHSGEQLLKVFEAGKYTVIFLDIYMQGITGLQTAEYIRKTDQECIIILSTISKEHALDGYDVKALYYIIKPVDYEKVEKALSLCQDILNRSSAHIEIMSNKQLIKVFLKDIRYIEVYGKTSIIHSNQEILKTYTPLEEIEKLLGGEPFIRCHRSYMVNLDYVADIIGNDFKLKTGEIVPIRKSGKTEAKILLAKYMIQ